jgi:hypothetical protein
MLLMFKINDLERLTGAWISPSNRRSDDSLDMVKNNK